VCKFHQITIGDLVIASLTIRWIATTAGITSTTRIASAASTTTTTSATSTAEYAAENLSEDINLGHRLIDDDVHVRLSVVLNRIDQRIQFLRVHDVAVVAGATARCINSISEKHDCLSSL